jgi:hypothetical protein
LVTSPLILGDIRLFQLGGGRCHDQTVTVPLRLKVVSNLWGLFYVEHGQARIRIVNFRGLDSFKIGWV